MFSTGVLPILPSRKGAIEPYVYGLAQKMANTTQMDVYGVGSGKEQLGNLSITAFPYPESIPIGLKKFLGGRLGYYLPYNAYLFKAIARLQTQKPVDIVHIHDIHCGPAASISKALFGIPYVCTIHNQIQTAKPVEACDKLLAVSQYIKDFLVTERGISPKKVEVVNIAVDCEYYKLTINPECAKRKLGFAGRRILLFVGRKCAEKGPQVLIDALPEIIKRYPNVVAVLVGPDIFYNSTRTFSENLEKKIRLLGLEKNVILVDYISEENLKLIYQAADILVFPSIWQEPFGKVILEAMCYRKPVVASAVGGVPEIVQNAFNGFLVNPNCPHDLTTAISDLLEDPDLAKMLGVNGQRFVKEKFSFGKAAEACIKIYKEIVF